MSLRNTATVAAFALTSVFASGAKAECDMRWVNTYNVGDQLFSVSPKNWNTAVVASLGAQNIERLSHQVQTSVASRMRVDARFMLDMVERDQKAGRESNWDILGRRSHVAFHPLMQQLKDHKISVADARAQTPEITGRYITAAMQALAKTPAAAPTLCLTK